MFLAALAAITPALMADATIPALLVARPQISQLAVALISEPLLDSESTTTCQEWSTREEWALLDEAPSFTVGDGTKRVTFWSSLALHPMLKHRSPDELQAHAASLNMPVGHEPKVLRAARSVSGGKTWTGIVDGHSRSINAASDGRLASGASFVESLSGEIFAAELISMSEQQEPFNAEEPWVERSSDIGTQERLAALSSDKSPTWTASLILRLQKVFDPLYMVAAVLLLPLLVGGQLLFHDAAPLSARVMWQQESVNHARKDVLDLEKWLEKRGQAYGEDQDRFMRRMEELEPRLRASEMRLAELHLLQ